MGQYYYVVNVTKRQYLHPHDFGDGLKLMEFGMSGEGTMTALAMLLASGNGRGGGDARGDGPIGSWAGDSIVIAGDYADPEVHVPAEDLAAFRAKVGEAGARPTLRAVAAETYENISAQMVALVKANA